MDPVESDPSTSFHILIRKYDALASFCVDSQCNTLLPPFFPLRFHFFFFGLFLRISSYYHFFFSSSLAFSYSVCVRVRVCVWGGEGTHLKTLEEEKKK